MGNETGFLLVAWLFLYRIHVCTTYTRHPSLTREYHGSGQLGHMSISEV
jgi:hypothetical protein